VSVAGAHALVRGSAGAAASDDGWLDGAAARRRLLRAIPCGLYVVGLAGDGGRAHAFTASWLAQASTAPPAVVLGVRRDSHAGLLARPGRALTVNYVARDDVALVRAFLRPSAGAAGRLEEVAHRLNDAGAPLLERAIGWLACEIRTVARGFGDHVAVIAEVLDARAAADAEPLRLEHTGWHYGG
jgi:flavin reductase (DIM6/NTAB) family NADH-FMN oxidoreductase RutF